MMKTVLVIDDNLEVRENTAELLELEGFNVLTATNGLDGFEQTKINLPDVVLCDVMMPELDGMGYLNLVKKDSTTSKIPLIFFSAGSAPMEVKSMQHDYSFLRKPFTDVALLAAITHCLHI